MSIEDDIRLTVRIDVESAKREVRWIDQRLAALKADRAALDKRERSLLDERTDCLKRIQIGEDALKGGKP